MGTTIKPGNKEAGFDHDVIAAENAQDGFRAIITGKVEEKTDFKFWLTGNVCIELFGRTGETDRVDHHRIPMVGD